MSTIYFKIWNVRIGTKDDLLIHIAKCGVTKTGEAPAVNVIIIDGAALVHMIKPKPGNKHFDKYAEKDFLPHLKELLKTVTRVDVWDEYITNILKDHTR